MNSAVDMAPDEIDLREAIALLWSKRWRIALSAINFAAIAGVVAFTMTPIYRATTAAVAAEGTDRGAAGGMGGALGQLGGLASLAGLGSIGNADSATEEALAVLRSREFTESFIRDENLMPEPFRDSWDEASKQWLGEQKNWPTLARGFRFFDSNVLLDLA